MIQQFQQFFNNDYTDFTSFLNKVLFPIFGENNFEKGYDVLTQDSEIEQKAAEAKIIEIKHIGTFSTDLAADIKLFEVVLSNNSRIERSRINIQQLIRRYVETFEGAFMVFHYDNPENRSWRFSYVEKRSSLTDSTSAKRYTYLFGKDYACRTAAQRFNDLYKLQQNITLQDITTAFSVEALSDEFFERYRNIYADFIEFISGKRFEKEKGKWVEKEKQAPDPQFQTAFAGNDKAVRDYVKKMLGRLVFLQFLQKKGWMGVPVDKSWGEGDSNYMQKLFATSNHKENFLEAVLEPLFFDTLNHERDNQVADSSLGENIKIPYLNGGLFEKDKLDKKTVVFPANYFKQLFDFFGEYNFTIDENDPNDAELGVDPEMLGRIFENLLEDNKDKGAFYTPKEIVQYMCRESLIAYLTTGNEANEDSIKELVLRHKADNLSDTLKEVLDQKLKELKVCDPAIGSGAFPMGMMNEIFKCRIAIEGITDNAADIKKHIIQNNIYGVDIENGAVDIARLRFWLALVVDETAPQPLPNLDYKIMQGNSLLESFEGHDLSRIIKTPPKSSNNSKTKITKNLFGEIENPQLSMGFDAEQTQANLNILIRDYFQIKNSEDKHLKAGMINTQIKEHIKTCAGHTPEMNKKVDDIDFNNKNFFLWRLYFADVFEKGGFDIVIGNPPYKILTKNNTPELNKYCKDFISFKKSSSKNLYILFIEKALYLLQKKGTFSYIVPEGLFKTRSYAGCVELLEKAGYVKTSVTFSSYVFENAVTGSLIFVFNNGQNGQTSNYHFDESFNLKEVEQTTNPLLLKIENASTALSTVSTLFKGMVVKDRETVISKDYIAQSHVFLLGKNITKWSITSRYFTNYSELDIVGGTKKIEKHNQYPRILIRRTGNSLCCALLEEPALSESTLYSCWSTSSIDNRSLIGLLNSKLLNYYNRELNITNQQGFPQILMTDLENLPIKIPKNQEPIIDLVDYILLLHKLGDNQQVNEFVPNSHIIQLFEEVIDACVYELYFEEDFKNAGISFIEYVERDFQSIEGKSKSEAIEIIHAAYQKLRENDNEIRNNLKLMDIKLADLIMPIKSMK